jgi:RimJ/RimL family protein N-acetyltransferase
MENPFRSSRLTYRAMESNDEDRKYFYEELNGPPEGLFLTDMRLLKPKSAKESNEDYNEIIGSNLLSVMICLSEQENAGNFDGKKLIPIGFLMLSANEKQMTQHRYTTLGISIAEAYRGKGYGPEAIKWALDWAFDQAALHSVRLGCFAYNVHAKRVYERIGFVLEGRRREGIWVNGGWHDGLMYSILDREWKEIKGRE